MPTPQGALYRGVAELTVGTVQSMREHDARRAEMGLSEIMQQFQIPFSGVATPLWGFSSPIELIFDLPFYYAPAQRDPDFEHPQFWFGTELDVHVAVSVSVFAWGSDPDNGAITGCSIIIGVFTPDEIAPYNGIVHATFQGFGALAEGEAETEVGD